jgi:uroporphyrinogen decarboxylase
MHKRERLECAIHGETVDRVPVAAWRHFPGDDQRAADLAAATVEFQKMYDWDFVKVSPASSFCISDYGVQDRWVGALEGTREYTHRAVERSVDWTTLKALDPNKGGLGRQLQTLNLLKDALGDTPYIQTIFSPLAQAKNISGEDVMIHHLRTEPERLHTGLRTITESTLRYLEAMRKSGISGIYYAIQHASYDKLSENEYRAFGRPYDLQVLEAARGHGWWLNVLHLHGPHPMFDMVTDYSIQAINWHDQEGSSPDLAVGKSKFGGAVCGGLGRWDVHNGTPIEVREKARNAINLANGRRFILAVGCVLMVTTPWSNIHAIREAAETTKV